MNFRNIKENVEAIPMPDPVRTRIQTNLHAERNRTRKSAFCKPLVIAATLILCLALPIGAAASGRQGRFRDVYNWKLAVVGTAYDNATEEIAVDALWTGEELLVAVTLLVPDQAPYPYIEHLSIGSYRVLDATGKSLCKERKTDAVPFQGHSVVFSLSMDSAVPAGSTLVIDTFISNAKTVQPLPISGNWKIPIRTIQ